MNYIKRTINLVAVIGIKDLGKMYTWINVAFGVRPNMRGHTGGAYTFSIGVFSAVSSKQKLNTGSSTECEVVGNSDVIIKQISFALFMVAQGYPIVENIVYKDNMSMIKLLVDGRKSCGKRLRHVEFYITL